MKDKRVTMTSKAPLALAIMLILTITLVSVPGRAIAPAADAGSGLSADGTLLTDEGLGGSDLAEYAPDRVLVKFKPWVEEILRSELLESLGAEVEEVLGALSLERIKVLQGIGVDEVVAALQASPLVETASPDFIYRAVMMPNDPNFSYQWHLDNSVYGGIHMKEAWDLETGDPSVVVAVVDTGVAYEDYGDYRRAPDLAGTSFVAGYDFANGDSHPNDDNCHGTHVTGTIAQSTNNNTGVAGVAFGCSVMPVKVLDSDGAGSLFDIAQGIIYAADNGADVINLSLGASSDYGVMLQAVAYAYNKGVTVVCASGNNNGPLLYPAAYDDYCIAVGATRYDETRASYSNYGSSLDLVAPGGDVSVDQNGDNYGDGVLQQTFNPDTQDPSDFAYWFFQGTSMATPHVAGVAALLISKSGASDPDYIRDVLEVSAEDKGASGRDNYYGYGLVDAAAALRALSPVITAVSPSSGQVGEEVTIAGISFGDSREASYVSFGVTEVTGYLGWSDRSIRVKVPEGISGLSRITVTTSLGTSEQWAFGVVPTLTGIDPASGAVAGQVVSLTGVSFGGNRGSSYVSFGGTAAAEYAGWTDTSIGVKLPAGIYGRVPVTVTTAGGTSPGITFEGPPPPVPVIEAVVDTEGNAGCEVTISGSGFAAERVESSVAFGDVAVEEYTLWSDTVIGCVVPQADPGVYPVTVATSGGVSNAVDFELTPFTWYLPEGATDGGMETWILVQNPGDSGVEIALDFLTGTGTVAGPRETLPAGSRRSYNAGYWAVTYDLSTVVTSSGGNVVCERATYGQGRSWATASVGSASTSAAWYLPEGATDGGMETWILVQNPGDSGVEIALDFLTGTGTVAGPRETLPAGSRRSYNAGYWAVTYDLSTVVTSSGGNVVCERATYGQGRSWATASVGSASTSAAWYLPEGATDGGMETWILVQNPGDSGVEIALDFLTGTGTVAGPRETLPAGSRRSYNAGYWAVTYDLSTVVTSSGGNVVCERATYGQGRSWATASVGSASTSAAWYLPEGATDGGMETWILVQNPGDSGVEIALDFLTGTGTVAGPRETLPAGSRRSYNAGYWAVTYDLSTVVTSSGGNVVCERATYGQGRAWGTASIASPAW